MDDKIDFVIMWVDGSDLKWQEKKAKYDKSKKKDDSNSVIRYRDWGLLKYWFRSVEKYTPWVNKIYFITDHQVPEWMNLNNEKLVHVNHEDYIPKEYLPVFSGNPIELCINKIEGLSDKFVFFNDDMFITNYLKPDYFFKDGKPKDELVFNATSVSGKNSIIEHTILNNLNLLSDEFQKRKIIKENLTKVYNLKYGSNLIRNFCLKPWKYFTGMHNPHMPIPYLKSSWDYVWNKYSDEFEKTLNNKFRSKDDCNNWIFRYYQLFSGNFIPKSFKKDKYYSLSNDNSKFLNELRNNRYNMVCINDSDDSIEYKKTKKELIDTFEEMLDQKSSFEK